MKRNSEVIENNLIDAATVTAKSSTMPVKMAALPLSVSFENMMDLHLLHCAVGPLRITAGVVQGRPLATQRVQLTILQRPVHPPNELDSNLLRSLDASNFRALFTCACASTTLTRDH